MAGSFFSINSAVKSPENHKQECKSAGLVATAAVVACSTKVVNAQYEAREALFVLQAMVAAVEDWL